MIEISTLGAILGLIIAIVLIFKEVHPFYAMVLGALIGGLVGGATLPNTINVIIDGAESMIPAVIRVLTAGVFCGVLIETGAANKISDTIIITLGEDLSLLAIIIASCIICAVGVVIPVTMITVAPVALLVGRKSGLSKASVLLAMLGGAKAGNVMSPNPNTIAIANGFHTELSKVMLEGSLPAIVAIVITFFIAHKLRDKGDTIHKNALNLANDNLPSFKLSIIGPAVVIILLALNSILHLQIDSMIILPLGGLIASICMGQTKNFLTYCSKGLNRMTGTAILLLGTGTIAGLISHSSLSVSLITIVNIIGIPKEWVASICGILMGGATASITAGSVVTSTVFNNQILHLGIKPVCAAEMVHTGVSVIDDLPHGNLFHISADSVKMNIKERTKLIPYEIFIGLSMNIATTIFFGFIVN